MTQPEQEDSNRTGTFVKRHHLLMCNGNGNDALLLSQIYNWNTRNDAAKTMWIAINHGDWFDKIGMNPRTVRSCLNRLKKQNLIEYKMGWFSRVKTPHMRINWETYHAILDTIVIDEPPLHPKGDNSF